MQSIFRKLTLKVLIAGAFCSTLVLSGCSWRDVAANWQFSSPKATVKTYTAAQTAEDAAHCFPASWPLAERKAFFGRLGEWTEYKITTVRPTLFKGERMSVYDGASVVIVPEDMEVVQELVTSEGKQRYWYLLRDCEGQWKIIALFKQSE